MAFLTNEKEIFGKLSGARQKNAETVLKIDELEQKLSNFEDESKNTVFPLIEAVSNTSRRSDFSCSNRSRVSNTSRGPDLQKILGKILSLSYVFPKFILRLS